MRVARRRTSSGNETAKPSKPKESNEAPSNGTLPNGSESPSEATATPASETADATPEKGKEKTSKS